MKLVILGMITAVVVVTMREMTIGQERRRTHGGYAFSHGIY